MNIEKINQKIENLSNLLPKLREELTKAEAAEVLYIGEEYAFEYGKGETKKAYIGRLIASGEVKSEKRSRFVFRFLVGEGLDQVFLDVTRDKIEADVELPEGVREASEIRKDIAKIENQIEDLIEDRDTPVEPIELTNNQSYQIKIGKGATKRIVMAILLGQNIDEDGKQEFNFFYGVGFEARTFIGTARHLVREEEQPVREEEMPMQQVE